MAVTFSPHGELKIGKVIQVGQSLNSGREQRSLGIQILSHLALPND